MGRARLAATAAFEEDVSLAGLVKPLALYGARTGVQVPPSPTIFGYDARVFDSLKIPLWNFLGGIKATVTRLATLLGSIPSIPTIFEGIILWKTRPKFILIILLILP